jgi:hypothetical protein
MPARGFIIAALGVRFSVRDTQSGVLDDALAPRNVA